MLTAYFVIVVLSLALFSAIGAVIVLWFDRSLDRIAKGEDGAFFCHDCNALVGYRVDCRDTIIARFVDKTDEPPPQNVINFPRYHSDSK